MSEQRRHILQIEEVDGKEELSDLPLATSQETAVLSVMFVSFKV